MCSKSKFAEQLRDVNYESYNYRKKVGESVISRLF